uniref:EF-hand domain-containing protein n=1 Tax=Phaeomonas parva TaxID=124430 RepID=A0A7S1U527_9STRA
MEGVEEEGGDENGNDDGDGEAFSSASKWKILGVEGDGLLHYGELQQGMKTLRKTGQVSPRLWASQLLAQADTDRNGAVDADEFYRILRPEPDPEKLMGLAYLSGFDTWAELPRRLGVHMTQGNKILATDWVDNQYIYVLPMLESLLEAASRWRESLRREVLDPFEALCEGYRNGGGVGRTCTGSFADFDGVVEEDRQCDLAADGDVFGRIAHRDRCAKQRRLLLELYASAYVTELRTEQVLALYRAQAPGVDAEAKDGCLEQSRSVIRRAEKVVRFMETYVYRVPAARIASWRGAPDPTAYRFTYLWAVSSLYFWWRDQGRAEARSPQARRSPCYLNRMDPSELAIGLEAWIMEKFKGVLKGMPRVAGLELGDCLAPPKDGFTFPDDL